MNIGERKVREADENRERVRAYFTDNPFDRHKECAAALELTPTTVGRHVAAIRRQLARQKKGKGK